MTSKDQTQLLFAFIIRCRPYADGVQRIHAFLILANLSHLPRHFIFNTTFIVL